MPLVNDYAVVTVIVPVRIDTPDELADNLTKPTDSTYSRFCAP